MDVQLPGDLDVAVVGAGISGLVLGRLLSGTGQSVAILGQEYTTPRNGRFAGLATGRDLRFLGIENVASVPAREIVTAGVDTERRLRRVTGVLNDAVAVTHDDLLAMLRRSCRERGVPVLAGATVSALRWQDGAVAGVIAGPGRQAVGCKLVVLADESDPRLAETSGLRPDWPPTRLTRLAKERFVGSAQDIQQRFGVESWGVRVFHLRLTTNWGDPAEAYIVPAGHSVTVGVNLLLEHEMASAHHVLEVLDDVKAIPEIQLLLSGLESSDVVTEVIPTGRGANPPRLVGEAIMLVSDAVGATNPLNRDGLSGNVAVCAAAANAIRDALEAGDVSARRLSPYQKFANKTVFQPARGWLSRRFGTEPSALIESAIDVTPARKSETLHGKKRWPVANGVGTLRRVGGRRSRT